MFFRLIIFTSSLFLLSACWNGENTSIRLGDISLGQQLVDLKSAYDANAISEDEYEDAKEALLAINAACGEQKDDESFWF